MTPLHGSGLAFNAGLLAVFLAGCGGDGDGSGGNAALGPGEPRFLTIEDGRFREGNRGHSTATFTIQLSTPSDAPVTVEYETRDGSARAGDDYESTSGTLQVSPGATRAKITLAVLGDGVDEGDEEFHLVLRNPQHASLEREEASGVIADDDPRPSLAIETASAREGPGDHTVLVAVELSPPSGRPVTVEYETRDGKAKAGSDYRTTSGELVFSPGMSEEHIEVRVLDDSRREPDENVRMVLRNARNAAIVHGEATLAIADDDAKEPTRDRSRKPSKKGPSVENGEDEGHEGDGDEGEGNEGEGHDDDD